MSSVYKMGILFAIILAFLANGMNLNIQHQNEDYKGGKNMILLFRIQYFKPLIEADFYNKPCN